MKRLTDLQRDVKNVQDTVLTDLDADERVRMFVKAAAEGRRPHPNSWEVPRDPERPTGMHHDTYEALLEDVRAARWEWEEAHMATLREMTGHLEFVRP